MVLDFVGEARQPRHAVELAEHLDAVDQSVHLAKGVARIFPFDHCTYQRSGQGF